MGGYNIGRLTSFCLCFMLIGLAGAVGCAGKGGVGSIPEKVASHSGQSRDLSEAKALTEKAQILMGQFDFYLALLSYKQALQIREEGLGKEHPDTAASMAGLARCYLYLGHFDKALPLAQQALQIREKVLGLEHPDTADSQMILGYLYGQMGVYDKAMTLAQQALRTTEKTLGPEDPQTAAILNDMAMLYTHVGSYDQALPRAQRAVRIREKVSGPDHPETSVALKNLGFLYLVKKDYGQAEACFRRAKHMQGAEGLAELFLATERYESVLDLLSPISPGRGERPQYRAQYYTQLGLAFQGLARKESDAAPIGAQYYDRKGLAWHRCCWRRWRKKENFSPQACGIMARTLEPWPSILLNPSKPGRFWKQWLPGRLG